jgi:hypothetical protein
MLGCGLVDRFHENLQQVIGAETDFASHQPNDARIAGTEHLDADALPQPKLLQTMDVVGPAEQSVNATGLSCR